MTNDLITIASYFTTHEKVTAIKPFGNGNVNDTFLVTIDALAETMSEKSRLLSDPPPKSPILGDFEGALVRKSPRMGGWGASVRIFDTSQTSSEEQFILQRINTQVFRQPQLVMQNMCIYTQHVSDRLHHSPPDRRWEVPQVLLTQDAQTHWIDDTGSFWRAISYIKGSQSFNILQNLEQAQEIGYALGMFHNLISDLPPEKLADTLEGFHITPLYLQRYEQVRAALQILQGSQSIPTQSSEVNYCLKFISDRQTWASILETAKAQNKLPLRLMHGDPKVNNVMFDTATHQAISVVDLDTVKPGLVHYDIGDCLRSGCNPIGEETEHWQTVQFEPDLCQKILQGYFSVVKAFFTENDYFYLYDAIRLIAFELGLRFFTDYLSGNVYFKVKYPEHNLIRALVQFKLTESIELQEATLRTIIRDLQ